MRPLDVSTHCTAQYNFLPSTMSSHDVPMLSSASHSTPVSMKTTLTIHVRRWRMVIFTVTIVLVLLLLVLALRRGFSIVKFTQTHDGVQTLVTKTDDFNFYFGTIASLVAKPFEIGGALILPMVVLLFLTSEMMHNDTLTWRLVILMAQSVFVSLLTNAFSTLNVQFPIGRLLERGIVDQDLDRFINTPSVSTLADGIGVAAPWIQPTNATILNNAFTPVWTPYTPSVCLEDDSEKRVMTVIYGFSSHDMFKSMLSNGIPPTNSLNLSMAQVANDSGRVSYELPYSITTAANLVIHAMSYIENQLRVRLDTTQVDEDPLESYATRALSSAADGNSPLFVLSTSAMVLQTLSRQRENGFFIDLPQIRVAFTSFAISSDISFDAVSISLPFERNSTQRGLRLTSYELFVEDRIVANKDLINEDGDAVYQVATNVECGSTSCLLTQPMDSSENPVVWTLQPQIHAFAWCHEAFSRIGTGPGYTSCPQESFSPETMLVGSTGIRLTADRMMDVKVPDNDRPDNQQANITNIQRTMTFTLGRLSWHKIDLSSQLKATCSVRNLGTCDGLTIELDGDQEALVSADHFALGDLMSIRSGRKSDRGLPLVSRISTVNGSFLPLKNVRRVDSYLINGPTQRCAQDVDRIGQQIAENGWEMEFGLQEAYTAGIFHLFQRGVAHRRLQGLNLRTEDQDALDLKGNSIMFEFRVSVPRKSVAVTVLAGSLLILSVVLVALMSQRREQELSDTSDVHRVARIQLVEQFFPKVFLNCQLDMSDGDGALPFAASLEHYRIVSMTLRQQTPEGEVLITLPPST
ncbi:hypothetical protein Poli38472_002998 [Pythium oligandrum]|uniref:Uncharacterized protein n=1 Tax=Pythium oligandrum TaxID=41045 RepID=A0A8K1FFR3_PYTOL|nr:hypothetical protein Poli38472_002998 [Pythium oligandrum]|eukprot:TMW57073.1 hypothetical protein Poli38472_002998 [Pythium oligandrum]